MRGLKLQYIIATMIFVISLGCAGEIPEVSSTLSEDTTGEEEGNVKDGSVQTKLRADAKKCNASNFFFDYDGRDGAGFCTQTRIFKPCSFEEVAKRLGITNDSVRNKMREDLDAVSDGYEYDQCLVEGSIVKVYFARETKTENGSKLETKSVKLDPNN